MSRNTFPELQPDSASIGFLLHGQYHEPYGWKYIHNIMSYIWYHIWYHIMVVQCMAVFLSVP